MFKFFTRNETKANSITKVDLLEIGAEMLGWGRSTKSGKSVTRDTSIEVAAVFCAVRVIAEGIAQMPLRIKRFERRADGKVFSPIEYDHWSVELLTRRPNEWMTPYEFREYAVFIAALTGNFIAIKHGGRADRREVRELLPVPPGNWTLVQDDKYNLLYEIKSNKGAVIGRYSPKDIFHLRGPTMDGFKGLAPIKLAREAIGLSMALEDQQATLAANGARPSGILSTDSKLKKEQAEKIKEAWNERFGANGEGGVALLDGGWQFHQVQMSSVDMQHLETRKHQIFEIARAFRVFPQMLMESDKTSTFASAEQFFTAHVIHTLGPWVERFEGVINRDILGNDRALFADLDERNLLRGSFKDQADYYAKALGSGGTPAWFTQNEVREEIGREPFDDPDTDRLFSGFQSNQQPTEDNNTVDEEDA